MATTIHKLAVKLTANTAAFTSRMGKAITRLRKFSKSASIAAMRIAKFGAVAAAAAAAGMAYLTKRAYATMDATAKMSQRLGIATEELLRLRHAAKLSGVDSRVLEMGLQRMVRRISEAAQGTGEARDAIKELGLDAKKLALMGPYKAFLRISDAMKGVANQGDRVRLSMKLWDSEGVRIVQVAQRGSKAIGVMGDALGRTGAEFSSIDATAIERVNDNLTDLGLTWSALGVSLARNTAPILELSLIHI